MVYEAIPLYFSGETVGRASPFLISLLLPIFVLVVVVVVSCSSWSHSGNIIRACLGTGWMEHAVQSVAKVIHGERDEDWRGEDAATND